VADVISKLVLAVTLCRTLQEVDENGWQCSVNLLPGWHNDKIISGIFVIVLHRDLCISYLSGLCRPRR
jgi:hypothetical protein